MRLLFDALVLLAGGTAGTLLRYGITHIWLSHLKYFMIPWPTLIVNSIGSFLIGALFELFKKTGIVIPHAEKFLFIGFLGAFTTFSTYSLESINLLR
jgi:CrcB protein